MPKYNITLELYQDIIVEADSPEDAQEIAMRDGSAHWEDVMADGRVYCDEYHGTRKAFNSKAEAA